MNLCFFEKHCIYRSVPSRSICRHFSHWCSWLTCLLFCFSLLLFCEPFNTQRIVEKYCILWTFWALKLVWGRKEFICQSFNNVFGVSNTMRAFSVVPLVIPSYGLLHSCLLVISEYKHSVVSQKCQLFPKTLDPQSCSPTLEQRNATKYTSQGLGGQRHCSEPLSEFYLFYWSKINSAFWAFVPFFCSRNRPIKLLRYAMVVPI